MGPVSTAGPPVPPPSERVRLRRAPQKGAYDAATVHAILDATPFCHLAFVHDDHPMVVPTLHVRVGEAVYLHGSVGGRTGLAATGDPQPVCVTVSLIDGLVLARSGFHHSINHRSVVIVGDATLVEDDDERLLALAAITDHVVPGRWEELRPPTRRELAATAVLRLPLDEASAKIRVGPPVDEPEDLALPIWAGVVPVRTILGAPQPSPDLAPDLPVSPSVARLTSPPDPAEEPAA